MPLSRRNILRVRYRDARSQKMHFMHPHIYGKFITVNTHARSYGVLSVPRDWYSAQPWSPARVNSSRFFLRDFREMCMSARCGNRPNARYEGINFQFAFISPSNKYKERVQSYARDTIHPPLVSLTIHASRCRERESSFDAD